MFVEDRYRLGGRSSRLVRMLLLLRPLRLPLLIYLACHSALAAAELRSLVDTFVGVLCDLGSGCSVAAMAVSVRFGCAGRVAGVMVEWTPTLMVLFQYVDSSLDMGFACGFASEYGGLAALVFGSNPSWYIPR